MSNSECWCIVDVGKQVIGLNLITVRGTTQTTVKALKCYLSVIGRKVSLASDSKEVGLEAATL